MRLLKAADFREQDWLLMLSEPISVIWLAPERDKTAEIVGLVRYFSVRSIF